MHTCKVCALAIAAAFPLAAQAALTVSFQAPVSGATVSGTLQGAACEATGTEIRRVRFSVDGTTLNEDSKSPWSCVLDTTKLANGQHTLMATAFGRKGESTTSQVVINVENAAPPPPPPPPSSAPTAVPTFESLGLYWKPASNPGAAGCSVRYRKSGEVEWKDGLNLWYDARNGECRGSLVHLAPDTTYEFELAVAGQAAVSGSAKTWSENFPIARVVEVPSGSTTLAITEGGTPEGYVLYTSPAGTQSTLDVADTQDFNVTISAPYVIVRGFTLRGARQDGIRLLPGAHDVVIEDNDISGWGRFRATLSNGWQVGMEKDSAVRAACYDFPPGASLERTVIQRNRMHDPRYTTNSWDFGHPTGPQAVSYSSCSGNHVIRYNEIYSADGAKYLNDGLGGSENFSNVGFPNSDSDIHGNRISHVWDDAIEAEGANRNVRIWGNYTDRTNVGVATTATSVGPVYVFRNVLNRSQKMALQSTDTADRVSAFKSGSTSSFGDGRRYVFHNTLLQATLPGLTYPLGAGGGISAAGSTQPLTNTVSRNNILHVWKSWWNSINTEGGAGNDLDYDLHNGNISAYAGAETNGIVGTPLYAPGHGWQNESGGFYQLDPASAGYDRGARLPNFNDDFLGAAPDMGAHETGSAGMRFGVQ